MLKLFERELNKTLKTRHLKVHVLVIPTARDRLIFGLVEGFVDIAAENLTITPGRLEQVDFSDPLFKGICEILVSGPAAPPLKSKADIGGLEIHVRESSSYYQSLVSLNAELSSSGKDKVKIRTANEYLEDEDLLEMVNAGLIPMIVVDSHKAKFWSQIFENITLHPIDTLNRCLLTFASYNAGPAKISQLRKEAAAMGLNPNIWFRNVEVAAAKRIGRETVQYVSNIFKYYIAYQYIMEQKQSKETLKTK